MKTKKTQATKQAKLTPTQLVWVTSAITEFNKAAVKVLTLPELSGTPFRTAVLKAVQTQPPKLKVGDYPPQPA